MKAAAQQFPQGAFSVTIFCYSVVLSPFLFVINGIGLSVYQFIINYFHCAVADVVHPSRPFHLIFFLELLGNSFLLRHFFYQPGEEEPGRRNSTCPQYRTFIERDSHGFDRRKEKKPTFEDLANDFGLRSANAAEDIYYGAIEKMREI